jgi:hypothetical protein
MRQESSLPRGVERALKKLESGVQSTRAAGAKELVQELVALGATKERIAGSLRISSPTIHRWASGKYSPRNSSKVRTMLNSPGFLNKLLHPGASEATQDAGIHSIDFFFEAATFAKNIYKCKSFLEFLVSDSEHVQRRMKHLLEQNNELRIYYIFPSESRAEETFCRFFELLVTLDEAWAQRIRKCPLEDSDGLLALGFGYTGLAIIEYSDEGRKRFGRLVDVLLEVPVRAYENGEPNPFLKKSVWIEFPTEQAHNLWSRWKSFMESRQILQPSPPMTYVEAS